MQRVSSFRTFANALIGLGGNWTTQVDLHKDTDGRIDYTAIRRRSSRCNTWSPSSCS